MQPISHITLVHMIKYAIAQHGLDVQRICDKATIRIAELEAVLDGHIYATCGFLAKLAFALNLDWSGVTLRYMAWRYNEEIALLKLWMLSKPIPAKSDELHMVARQIIMQSPDAPADLLAEELRQALLLDMWDIKQQIAHVRMENTGDYDCHG